jgi:radical SAM protein with 4Fe4S-binding SPASM domain
VFPGKKGTHAAIKRTVALMHERGLDVGAICVVSKANCRRLDKVLADYANLGLECIKLNPVSKNGRATEHWDALALGPEEFLEVHMKYLTLVLQGCSVLDSNTNIMLQLLGTKIHPYRCMRSQCGAGRDFMTFATNGDIYPCPRTRVNPEFRLANVAEVNRLDDLWKNNSIVSKLAERQAGTVSECRQCTYKRFCEAGCPIDSYEHFGKTDAPHPWCQYYKGIYSELFRRLGEGRQLVEIFCPDAKIYENSFFS